MCDYNNSIWECRDCDWISSNRRDAYAHRIRHRIEVRYNGEYPEEFDPKFIVGKCFACGMLFSYRISWQQHERQMDFNLWDQHRRMATPRFPTMERQEAMAYRMEPEYVKRFKNSPGSPVGSKDNPDWAREAARFRRERKKLTGK